MKMKFWKTRKGELIEHRPGEPVMVSSSILLKLDTENMRGDELVVYSGDGAEVGRIITVAVADSELAGKK